jgi:hypothetical protein
VGAASLTCDRCRTRLPVAALNTQDLVACPGCHTPLRFLVFPAYYRAHQVARTGEQLMVEGESSCFYHPTKKAVVPCDACGRFLCALCDMELDAKHLCPKCLEAAREKRTMESLETERFRYDSLALGLAVVGVIPCFWYFLIFIAPTVLFLVIRHWNSPASVVENVRWRLALAGVLATLELLFFVGFVGLIIIGALASNG